MDMSKHLPRWINNAELTRLGGRYEGTIASVVENRVHNRFTGEKELQPVICFTDGYRVVPNITMRRALVDRFGPESDAWTGMRLAITCRRSARTDASTGTTREVWKKHLELPDDREIGSGLPSTWEDGAGLDETDPIGSRDEEDQELAESLWRVRG